MQHLKRQTPRQGLISINNKAAGYVQILESKAFGTALHAILLDRGPVWFNEYGSEEHFAAFVKTFRKKFPKRPGRKIRFIPEMQDTQAVRNTLNTHKFKRHRQASYKTDWLDLSLDEDTLRQNLKKKWRNALSKAEKNSIAIEWDSTGEHLTWLMEKYLEDKITKGYDGPSVKLMNALAQNFARTQEMLIGRALDNGKPIGAILLFCHGRSATYQIGWNSAQGRDYGAHNLLLWDAIKQLKNRKILSFDLGGMNDETAKNVKKFKEGLGGTRLTLPGLYT